jgi:hypothetical protein
LRREPSLPGPWLHGAVNLGADGARKEERRAGPLRKVLEVEDGESLRAERLQEESCLLDCAVGVDQLHRSARDVIVLQVDQYPCFVMMDATES